MGSACMQASAILRPFADGEEKMDAALMLFTRLVSNSSLEGLSAREQKRLSSRLGVLTAFRATNPTGHYELSLSSVWNMTQSGRKSAGIGPCLRGGGGGQKL